MASSGPGFDEVADELYALAPADFTSVRDRHADRLKKDDPQLARRIRALHRPTRAAWAANLLAHRHPGLVGELLDLGRALRDAQAHLAGEQLRGLVEQRRQLVRALTGQAEQDAEAAGHPLGADAVAAVDRTLTAALADPDAGRALAAGRLTAPLEPVLWPGSAGDGPPAGEPGRGTRKAPAPGVTAELKAPTAAERKRLSERDRARKAVTAAERAASAAGGRSEDAERALAEAEAALREVADEAGRARDALAEARDALAEAREREARARKDLPRAEKRARAARAAADAAGEQAGRARDAAREAAEQLRELEAGDHGGSTG
ncbi:hypothetical protein ACWDRR_31285 [Kitasatospora sp. NPDC003701]